jgi:amino-acid N-acetyltransferase
MFFRFEADSLVGYGGLEGDGADRLLRSIVIPTDRRGHGLGRALVATLEQQARDLGVRRLHLLATTAAPFFRALGYADADRGAAPPAVASSREFTGLCPASAAYLVKAL